MVCTAFWIPGERYNVFHRYDSTDCEPQIWERQKILLHYDWSGIVVCHNLHNHCVVFDKIHQWTLPTLLIEFSRRRIGVHRKRFRATAGTQRELLILGLLQCVSLRWKIIDICLSIDWLCGRQWECGRWKWSQRIHIHIIGAEQRVLRNSENNNRESPLHVRSEGSMHLSAEHRHIEYESHQQRTRGQSLGSITIVSNWVFNELENIMWGTIPLLNTPLLLCSWENGENHLLFNIVPNQKTIIDLNSDRAMIAGADFDSWTYRTGFDFAIPFLGFNKTSFQHKTNLEKRWALTNWNGSVICACYYFNLFSH